MGISPRDLRRNMSPRKGQGENPTSIVETGIPPRSQKSSAIIMEKMDLQIALSKECGRRMDEYGDTLKGMDRMLMEYDNQLMECQMQLSKYDNQLMESQKLLSECSGRLLSEVPGTVLTKELLEQYDGALAEYKNAVDKYYGLIEQYQEQINKLMGTEEDRMAGVQMALDLTYIKEELDELKQYIENAMKPEEPEAEEISDDVEEEDGEQVIEKLFDVWDEANLQRFQAEIKLIEDKSEHIIQTVQDVVYTHNSYIDGKFKDLDSKLVLADEHLSGMLEEQFKLADVRREEGILKQNQTLTDKLQAQNNLLGDKLEALNELYTQTLEEKLLVQSKTMVDKLQVQNHFLEEVEEGQNQFILESLNKQSEYLSSRLAQQGKGLEELLEKQGADVEGKIGARIEALLKKPEDEEKEEEEEDEVVKLLNESKASLKEDKEEIIKRLLGVESIVKDEKGQVANAKSELTVLIDRTMGPVERKVGKLSKLAVFSLILNLISLLGIVALLMQIYT